MIVIAPQFTQKTFDWPSWKVIQIKKGFAFQHDEDAEGYLVYGYDGPEVYICRIYSDKVPAHVQLDQALNDSWKEDFEANYAPRSNKTIDISRNNPFAEPVFRTKFNATDSIIECAPGEIVNIDFPIAQEVYISGGLLLSKNQELGDHVVGEVIDKDGIIPEEYRAALCESWPTVSRYIEKLWVSPTGKSEMDTYPLNAKIAQGLYLRISYHASNEGVARKIAMNYYLTKRL